MDSDTSEHRTLVAQINTSEPATLDVSIPKKRKPDGSGDMQHRKRRKIDCEKPELSSGRMSDVPQPVASNPLTLAIKKAQGVSGHLPPILSDSPALTPDVLTPRPLWERIVAGNPLLALPFDHEPSQPRPSTGQPLPMDPSGPGLLIAPGSLSHQDPTVSVTESLCVPTLSEAGTSVLGSVEASTDSAPGVQVSVCVAGSNSLRASEEAPVGVIHHSPCDSNPSGDSHVTVKRQVAACTEHSEILTSCDRSDVLEDCPGYVPILPVVPQSSPVEAPNVVPQSSSVKGPLNVSDLVLPFDDIDTTKSGESSCTVETETQSAKKRRKASKKTKTRGRRSQIFVAVQCSTDDEMLLEENEKTATREKADVVESPAVTSSSDSEKAESSNLKVKAVTKPRGRRRDRRPLIYAARVTSPDVSMTTQDCISQTQEDVQVNVVQTQEDVQSNVQTQEDVQVNVVQTQEGIESNIIEGQVYSPQSKTASNKKPGRSKGSKPSPDTSTAKISVVGHSQMEKSLDVVDAGLFNKRASSERSEMPSKDSVTSVPRLLTIGSAAKRSHGKPSKDSVTSVPRLFTIGSAAKRSHGKPSKDSVTSVPRPSTIGSAAKRNHGKPSKNSVTSVPRPSTVGSAAKRSHGKPPRAPKRDLTQNLAPKTECDVRTDGRPTPLSAAVATETGPVIEQELTQQSPPLVALNQSLISAPRAGNPDESLAVEKLTSQIDVSTVADSELNVPCLGSQLFTIGTISHKRRGRPAKVKRKARSEAKQKPQPIIGPSALVTTDMGPSALVTTDLGPSALVTTDLGPSTLVTTDLGPPVVPVATDTDLSSVVATDGMALDKLPHRAPTLPFNQVGTTSAEMDGFDDTITVENLTLQFDDPTEDVMVPIPLKDSEEKTPVKVKKKRKGRRSADFEIMNSSLVEDSVASSESPTQAQYLPMGHPGVRRSGRIRRKSLEIYRATTRRQQAEQDDTFLNETIEPEATEPCPSPLQDKSQECEPDVNLTLSDENSNEVLLVSETTSVPSSGDQLFNNCETSDLRSVGSDILEMSPNLEGESQTDVEATSKSAVSRRSRRKSQTAKPTQSFKSATVKTARSKKNEPSIEDIYLNKLWRTQMPQAKTWETIFEQPKPGPKQYQSTKKAKRNINFDEFYLKSRLKRRRQKALKQGWRPFTAKQETRATKLLDTKLTDLEKDLNLIDEEEVVTMVTEGIDVDSIQGSTSDVERSPQKLHCHKQDYKIFHTPSKFIKELLNDADSTEFEKVPLRGHKGRDHVASSSSSDHW